MRSRITPWKSAALLLTAALVAAAGCGRPSEPAPEMQATLLLLGSASPEERYQGLGNLQVLGAGGKDAVPELRKLLAAAKDDDFAAEIARTLGMMGPAGADAVPELVRLLDRKAMWPRYAAVVALGNMGPSAAPAFNTLVKLTKDPDTDVAAAARESAHRIQRAAKHAPKKK